MQQPPDDILDWHFEALRKNDADQVRRIEMTPDLPAATIALFSLVHLLWTILRPVPPRPAFRTELREQVVAEAERRRTQAALGYGRPRPLLRPRWVVPAAAIGTVSLMGALAYWRLSRQTQAPRDILAA